MEIITIIRKGTLPHKNSQGNKGRTAQDEIQLMRSGAGIYHSEYNQEKTETLKIILKSAVAG